MFWQHWLFLHQQSTSKNDVTQNGMNNFISSQCLCSAAKKFLKHKNVVTSYYYLIWHLVRAPQSIFFLKDKLFTISQLQHVRGIFNVIIFRINQRNQKRFDPRIVSFTIKIKVYYSLGTKNQ